MMGEIVVLIGPTRRDGEVTREILSAKGIACLVQRIPTDPHQYLADGVGALIFTEQAIADPSTVGFFQRMESKLDWAALPIVLLCRNGHESPLVTRALEFLENVTILDRPCSMRAMVSAVKAALRVSRTQTQIQNQIRALTLAETELRLADSRKDQFLATLAHELRNPLAPIRTGLEILAQQSAARGGRDPVLGIMDRQITMLVRMVDELLDVSRISTGKVVLQRAVFDLREAVEAAVESCLPALEEAGHQLLQRLPDQPLPIDGDAIRIAQAIANLLGNAIKYTPPGGRITVSLARADNQAVLRVDDTGIGIPADMIQHVFEVFAQVESSRARAQGGLGIGLSLVRNLIELHGGSVRAESQGAGAGSRFEIRLAMADAAAAAATGASGNPAGQGQPTSGHDLLVIDDNREAADALGMLMELAGHRVRVVYDAPSGLREMDSTLPEVVFCDIGMPGMDGFAFATAVRDNPQADRTALIALTGWGSEDFRQRARAVGFDLHLTKPVDSKAIAQALVDSIARRREPASPSARRPE